MSKTRKVIRTGNSLAITIPSQTAGDLDIKEGDIAIIKISRSKGIISYHFAGHPRQLTLIKEKM